MSYQPVSMPGGLDYLMRPVLRGMCKYESLLDSSLDISDIAIMNDAIDVETENQNRAQSASRTA